MPPRLIPNFVNKTYFHRKKETTLEVNSSMNENRKYSSNPNTAHPITKKCEKTVHRCANLSNGKVLNKVIYSDPNVSNVIPKHS